MKSLVMLALILAGSVVARAELTVTNEATGAAEKVSSNADGYYIFPDLRPGSYRITCTAAGFRTTKALHMAKKKKAFKKPPAKPMMPPPPEAQAVAKIITIRAIL